MRICAALVAAMLAGCTGSLSVSIDVLDPAYARAEVVATQRTEQCLMALKETGGVIDQEIAEINRALREAHEALSQCYVTTAAGLEAGAQQQQLQQMGAELVINSAGADSTYLLGEYAQQRIQRMQLVQTAAAPLADTLAACRNPPPDLAMALVERRNVVSAKQSEIDVALGRLQRAAATDCPTATAAQESEIEEKVQQVARVVASPVAGLTLGSSPYAYALAAAPEEYWDNEFNEAFGRGVMGNVDIAVKLNEEADFSVKGMRFDASKVAEVAGKVTTQAVLLASRIAGGPARSGRDDSQGAAADAVAEAQQLVEERRAIEAARRQALSDFALTLVDSRRALQAGAEVTRELEIVRSRLDTVMPLLRLDDLDDSE